MQTEEQKAPIDIEKVKQLNTSLEQLADEQTNERYQVLDELVNLYKEAEAYEEAAEAQMQLIDLIDEEDAEGLGHAQWKAGKLWANAGKLEEAITAMEAAVELLPEAELPELLFQLGQVYREHEDIENATETLNLALEHYESQERTDLSAETHYILAECLIQKRDWMPAAENLETGLALFMQDTEKNGEIIAQTYHLLGNVHFYLQEPKKAFDQYMTSIKWKRKVGLEKEVGKSYRNIGRIFELKREWGKALQACEKGAKWDEQSGNLDDLANNYEEIAQLYKMQNNWDKAAESYKRSIEGLIQAGNEIRVGYIYDQIGSMYEEVEDSDNAITYFQLALEWFEKTQNEQEQGGTHEQLARLYDEQGAKEKAIQHYESCVAIYEALESEKLTEVQDKLDKIKNPPKKGFWGRWFG